MNNHQFVYHTDIYKISIFGDSEQGPRDYQQDRSAFKADDHRLVLTLADGMGGHANGDLAAQNVIDSLDKYPEEILTIKDALIAADRLCKGRRDYSGSTASIVEVRTSEEQIEIEIHHVGDSQIKILCARDSKCLYESTPQVNYNRSLTNTIGFLFPRAIENKVFTFNKNNLPLIIFQGSDGCYEYIKQEDILNSCKEYLNERDTDPAKVLVEKSLVKTTDNTTCLITMIE